MRQLLLTIPIMLVYMQVTSTRKGLRNQFKALLGLRKPGTLSPETARPATANGTYDNSSPEGQLRHLGDLAFMLQVTL